MLSTSLNKTRFCNKSLWKAGLPDILRKNNFYKNYSHIFHGWTERAWVNEDIVYESTKFQNHFFGPNTHASVKNRTMGVLNHKWAKWVSDPNI